MMKKFNILYYALYSIQHQKLGKKLLTTAVWPKNPAQQVSQLIYDIIT